MYWPIRIVSTLVVLFAGTLDPVVGHKAYQLNIPNGEKVPHPCKPNFIWHGVGHTNQMGGGKRNIFGEAFRENKHKWTMEFCNQDSDGDGRTNGEELGDPDCIWEAGAQPSIDKNLSHPGICDPYDSPNCEGKADFVNCDYTGFECEHIHDEDVFNFTINVSEYPVPSDATSYMCLAFEFPTDLADDYHIIADRPSLDNMNVIHHMMTYGVCDCREQVSQVIRKDGSSVSIGTDNPYNYDNPSTHRYPEGIVVSPGDEITTTCVFQSTSRTEPTYSGKQTSEEMCMAFIMFYPSENFKNDKRCYQMSSIDICDIQTGHVDGCSIADLYNPFNLHTRSIIDGVNKYCDPHACRAKCLNYVREIKRQPCFHGDVDIAIRFFENSWVGDHKSWYAAFDSCDDELSSGRKNTIPL